MPVCKCYKCTESFTFFDPKSQEQIPGSDHLSKTQVHRHKQEHDIWLLNESYTSSSILATTLSSSSESNITSSLSTRAAAEVVPPHEVQNSKPKKPAVLLTTAVSPLVAVVLKNLYNSDLTSRNKIYRRTGSKAENHLPIMNPTLPNAWRGLQKNFPQSRWSSDPLHFIYQIQLNPYQLHRKTVHSSCMRMRCCLSRIKLMLYERSTIQS